MVRNLIDRSFLLLAFIQLGLEYQSLNLFLWPLNHSCARPPSSQLYHQPAQAHAKEHWPEQESTPGNQQRGRSGESYTFEDSRRNLIDPDAIQTNLFDAYPDDLFTRARAYSMGIKYDDIAGCLQYRQEFNNKTNTSSVDLSQLETCPHGLHFEEPSQTASVVAVFSLACSRQYLTILMPNAFALGLLAGTILPAYYLIARASGQQPRSSAVTGQPLSDSLAGPTNPPAQVEAGNHYQQPAANLYYWFLVQIIAGLIIQIQTYTLSRSSIFENTADDYDHAMNSPQHPELYGQFVCCILLRSFIAASNLTRIIFMWNASQQEQETTSKRRQRAGNRKMIRPSSSSSSKESPLSSSYELFRRNHKQFLMFSATFICFKAVYTPMALRLFSSWWQLNEWLTVYSFCLTFAVLIRELSRMTPNKRAAQPEVARGSVIQDSSANNQLVSETNVDEVYDDGDQIDTSMEAAELHRCEFCSLNDHPLSIVDNPYAPTTTTSQHDGRASAGSGSGNLWGPNRVYHQINSFARQNLLSRALVVQLVLVTFCLSLNYFLLQWLPDHQLLHSETTASRFQRKTSYAEDMAKVKQPSDLLAYAIDQGKDNDRNPSSTTALPLILLHNRESYLDQPSKTSKGREFDFRSRNEATLSVDAMANSGNPLEVLWTTAKLFKWPLDLFVLLLHLGHLSNFESAYFKLSRLFVLVQSGAKFLALEWLVMGILRRQNHLLEWEWLYTICLLAARLSSTLMLFNYINTMLKLNTRLMTNKLMLFVPNTLACALAILTASYAPLLEWLDLVTLPIGLIVVNLSILGLTRQLNERFRANLCPMIFEEQRPSGLTPSQRMVLIETNTDVTC